MNAQLPGGIAPGPEFAGDDACSGAFLRENIRPGAHDKLGNCIREVLWCGLDYTIYRTDKGVFINFSDCAKREKEQRIAFTTICPELCELRFLTHEMHGAVASWLPKPLHRSAHGRQHKPDAASLFDHNIAQALMLLMEGKPDEAKSIATAALDMAVKRSTNDNTIRYLKSALCAAAVGLAITASLFLVLRDRFFDWDYYTVAAFGVIGAIFSVASRVQSFQAKPCQQSNMNYVMAWVRIGIGIVSAIMLYLVLGKSLGPTMLRAGMLRGAESAAVIGFLGGFAERLVPTLFGRAAQAFEESSGTPVQLAKARPSFDGNPAGVRPPG